MSKSSLLLLIIMAVIEAGCGDRLPTSPQDSVRDGIWGSNEAVLIVNGGTATLQLPNGLRCYGSYGEIDHLIPAGRFSLSGTFTQLTGVSPGKLQYAAEFSGNVDGNQMTILGTVPSLQRTIGPFTLTYGNGSSLPPCLFP